MKIILLYTSLLLFCYQSLSYSKTFDEAYHESAAEIINKKASPKNVFIDSVTTLLKANHNPRITRNKSVLVVNRIPPINFIEKEATDSLLPQTNTALNVEQIEIRPDDTIVNNIKYNSQLSLPPPLPKESPTNIKTICKGESTTLTVTGIEHAIFRWFDENDNLLIESENFTTPPLFSDVTYFVNQTDPVTNLSSEQLRIDIRIDIKLVPRIKIYPRCDASFPKIEAMHDSCSNYRYTWYVPPPAVNPGDVKSFNTTVFGVYTVMITDIDTGETSELISVITAPQVPKTITLSDYEICLTLPGGLAPLFSDEDNHYQDDYTYVWSGPLGFIPPETNQFAIESYIPGIYHLTVTNKEFGCHIGTVSAEIKFKTAAAPVIYGTDFCTGGSTTIRSAVPYAQDYQFFWTGPPNFDIPEVNVNSFSTNIAGTYTLVIVPNDNSCITDPAIIEITEHPLPVATMNDVTVCEGYSATLTAEILNPNLYSYEWTGPPGFTAITTTSNELISDIPGDYTVTVINNLTLCRSVPVTKTIFNIPFPPATITNVNDCLGQTATVTLNIANPLNYTYEWIGPPGFDPSGITSNSLTTQIPGNYIAILTNLSNSCRSKPFQTTVSFTSEPIVTINNVTICQGEVATLTAIITNPDNYTYSWTGPAGFSDLINVDQTSITTTIDGIYNLIFTNKSNGCNAGPITARVFVNSLPTATVSDVTICEAEVATLTAQIPSPSLYSFTWTGPTGFITQSSVGLQNISTNIGGTYAVRITNLATGCVSEIIHADVIINELPVATVEDQIVCSGTNVILRAEIPDAGNFSFIWSGPNGIEKTGNDNYISTYTTGIYQVILVNKTTSCRSVPIAATITNYEIPQVNVIGENFCYQDQTTIQAVLLTNSEYDYEWTVPNTMINPGNVNSFNTSISGDYSVVITDRITGCKSSLATKNITEYIPNLVQLIPGDLCIEYYSKQRIPHRFITGTDASTNIFTWFFNDNVIPNETKNYYDADSTGVYKVRIQNITTGCLTESSAQVGSIAPIEAIAIKQIINFKNESELIITINGGTGNYIYELDGVSQDSNRFSHLKGGYYTLKIYVVGGCMVASIQIKIIDYPKFFTPNDDGYNDTWNIPDLSDQPDAVITIFDRFGKFLSRISPTGAGWDGKLNDKPLPASDYWFVVEYKDEEATKNFRAHFSLLR